MKQEVTTAVVMNQLKKFGLNAKPLELLENKLLRLRWKEDKLGEVIFQRRNKILEMKDNLYR